MAALAESGQTIDLIPYSFGFVMNFFPTLFKKAGTKISSATQIVPLASPGLQASEVHHGAELSFSQPFVK
ncbi:hypothetical protein GCM10009091_48760 [Pseudomonas brenneri]|uniref:Uncharacterized protein n=1 Tax=Pseudomonas brenneri TaxID=129817 RepID=A0A5B2UJS8_9PSED|nr:MULTISPECIES: hypothetical protein [Pseudomonas]KAA2226722.1 hypothetical protein F1720_24920 [Pseudomonas brenneri]TWR74875.1 hypothetical protein FJD34_25345 [Pseudomonas brenneri]GGL61295.1 hypothetical protein GCM10009091_48760 [Pseudomonas brenneri]